MVKDTELKIQEFKDKGFARSSEILLHHIRNQSDLQIKIFKFATASNAGTTGSIKYSSFDIFGDRLGVYYYNIEFKKDFVDFLVNKFLKKNPKPDKNIRKAFTRILHSNGLHWHGCAHGRMRYIVENNNNLR